MFQKARGLSRVLSFTSQDNINGNKPREVMIIGFGPITTRYRGMIHDEELAMWGIIKFAGMNGSHIHLGVGYRILKSRSYISLVTSTW